MGRSRGSIGKGIVLGTQGLGMSMKVIHVLLTIC